MGWLITIVTCVHLFGLIFPIWYYIYGLQQQFDGVAHSYFDLSMFFTISSSAIHFLNSIIIDYDLFLLLRNSTAPQYQFVNNL